MTVWLIVLSWWAQDLLDRPRRKHLTTDPSCVEHRAPRPGSWLDRASRGLECEPCMIRRAFASPAWAGGAADRVTAHMFAPGADSVEAFDRWLAAHDAEVRAEAQSDPAEDERLVRYMAMATPLGYQAALSVVQQMTLMIQAETEARRAGVVTEEPEWEYGIRNTATGKTGWPWTRDEALNQAHVSPMFEAVKRIRTGWVPVEQEGAGHEGDA